MIRNTMFYQIAAVDQIKEFVQVVMKDQFPFISNDKNQLFIYLYDKTKWTDKKAIEIFDCDGRYLKIHVDDVDNFEATIKYIGFAYSSLREPITETTDGSTSERK